ncbi:MAG: aminodeoxychorismate lyase, partial [Cyclobacteriaceae bacterium]|nr:aminodeoxychorismate lyase [Cyclobacteriaceae bacterium]
MRKNRFGSFKGLIAFLVVTVLMVSFSFYAFQIVYVPNILVEKEGRYIIIPEGSTFKDVQNLLYEEKIVNDLVAFSFLAKIMDYHKS